MKHVYAAVYGAVTGLLIVYGMRTARETERLSYEMDLAFDGMFNG
jgi:hypothetical protein